MEQHTAVVKRAEAELTVEFDGWHISIPYLHVDRFATSTLTLIKEFGYESTRDPLPAELGFDEQVVDMTAQSSMLHGVAERQHRMSGSNVMALS